MNKVFFWARLYNFLNISQGIVYKVVVLHYLMLSYYLFCEVNDLTFIDFKPRMRCFVLKLTQLSLLDLSYFVTILVKTGDAISEQPLAKITLMLMRSPRREHAAHSSRLYGQFHFSHFLSPNFIFTKIHMFIFSAYSNFMLH